MWVIYTHGTLCVECRLLSGARQNRCQTDGAGWVYRDTSLSCHYTHGTLCVVCRLMSGYRPVMWVIYTHGTLYVDCCQGTGQ